MNRVIRHNPRGIYNKRKIFIGTGADMVIKRNNKNEDFSEMLNPAAAKVGLNNIDKKQMAPNPSNQFKVPTTFELHDGLLNGVSFKRSSKQKPKKVKLNI
jgi:hypothetical protein